MVIYPKLGFQLNIITQSRRENMTRSRGMLMFLKFCSEAAMLMAWPTTYSRNTFAATPSLTLKASTSTKFSRNLPEITLFEASCHISQEMW